MLFRDRQYVPAETAADLLAQVVKTSNYQEDALSGPLLFYKYFL
jgi:hypothetical protein